MKRIAWCAVLVLSVVGSGVSFAQDSVPPKNLKGKIIYVDDGDTVAFLPVGEKRIKIRFQGIDAPEIDHKAYPDKPATLAQPFGVEAKDFVFRNASGHQATVSVDTIDKYGRSVGTIFLEDGTNLNEALVQAGLAWWYAKYTPNNPKLARLEAEARHQGLGLFKDSDPTPPWIFRHPELQADWEKNKCELTSRDCSAEKNPTLCQVSVAPLPVPSATDVKFDASGPNECVARRLLEYQLCRGERASDMDRIECGPAQLRSARSR